MDKKEVEPGVVVWNRFRGRRLGNEREFEKQ